jgi:hypothetical protein
MASLPSKKERARTRIEETLAAVATFARIREELLLIQLTTPLGPRRERIDRMISLNQQTLNTLRRSLTIAEESFSRESATV